MARCLFVLMLVAVGPTGCDHGPSGTGDFAHDHLIVRGRLVDVMGGPVSRAVVDVRVNESGCARNVTVITAYDVGLDGRFRSSVQVLPVSPDHVYCLHLDVRPFFDAGLRETSLELDEVRFAGESQPVRTVEVEIVVPAS